MRNTKQSIDSCTWPLAVRWLLFLPIGLISTSIAQAIIRWGNLGFPYTSELLAVAVEPWAFLAPALWVLPRFHRAFSYLFTFIYVAIHLISIYQITFVYSIASPWHELLINITAIIAGIATVLVFIDQRSR